jgi:tetratricopeptide (TPR) repeat protein
MRGSFAEGLLQVDDLNQKLKDYSLYLDDHRILVFNYKIANLYFGSGKYEIAIDYLQKIINGNIELRHDLHCYARLLHLMAHYEIGNNDLIESLTKSVYRFMAKMKNLTIVEEKMFKFLQQSLKMKRGELQIALKNLLESIKQLEKNRYQTRTFAYLDIISWLESKVTNMPLSNVIATKYAQSKVRIYKRGN